MFRARWNSVLHVNQAVGVGSSIAVESSAGTARSLSSYTLEIALKSHQGPSVAQRALRARGWYLGPGETSARFRCTRSICGLRIALNTVRWQLNCSRVCEPTAGDQVKSVQSDANWAYSTGQMDRPTCSRATRGACTSNHTSSHRFGDIRVPQVHSVCIWSSRNTSSSRCKARPCYH